MNTAADRFPLPQAAWYVGVASTQLTGSPVAVRIHDQPIALFRDEDGVAHAVMDRCPHRAVALSLGTIEEGMITCPYHGWRFDGSGQCRHIPSLSEGQAIKDTGLRGYLTSERDGYVWIWTGAEAPEQGPLAIDGFADRLWLQGAIDLACEPILPIENNLDICHAAFTHPNEHPQWFRVQQMGFLQSQFDVETTNASVVVRGPGTLLRFDVPDRVTVGSGEFRLILHHTPTKPGRCTQHWLLQREPVDQPRTPIWIVEPPKILAQDQRILESAQAAYDEAQQSFERSVMADSPTLAARRVLSALIKNSAPIGREVRTIFVRN